MTLALAFCGAVCSHASTTLFRTEDSLEKSVLAGLHLRTKPIKAAPAPTPKPVAAPPATDSQLPETVPASPQEVASVTTSPGAQSTVGSLDGNRVQEPGTPTPSEV